MAKSKKGSDVHRALQDAVVTAINDPHYVFALPALLDWQSVVSCTAAEKQRLEFVGDAVMHLSMALCLYQLFPDASPGLYTNIRSAVNTNATFTHLMVKVGAYQFTVQSRPTKAVADSFEVIVAALYMERGFEGVLAWVQEQYAPLIAAARRSYDENISPKQPETPASTGSAKRVRTSPHSSSMHPFKRVRHATGRGSPGRTMMARRIISGMKSKGSVKLRLSSRKPKLSLEKRLKSYKMISASPRRKQPQIIDLTLDSDIEDSSSDTVQPRQGTQGMASGSSFQSLGIATRSSQHAHQDFDKPFTCHWPPEERCISGPSLRSHSSSPPCISCCATVTPASPHLNESGLSLPQHSKNMHCISGSYKNPIIVDDSDIEEA